MYKYIIVAILYVLGMLFAHFYSRFKHKRRANRILIASAFAIFVMLMLFERGFHRYDTWQDAFCDSFGTQKVYETIYDKNQNSAIVYYYEGKNTIATAYFSKDPQGWSMRQNQFWPKSREISDGYVELYKLKDGRYFICVYTSNSISSIHDSCQSEFKYIPDFLTGYYAIIDGYDENYQLEINGTWQNIKN